MWAALDPRHRASCRKEGEWRRKREQSCGWQEKLVPHSENSRWKVMKWACAQHGQGASGQVVCQDGREESRCSQGTVRGPDLITPFRSWAGRGVWKPLEGFINRLQKVHSVCCVESRWGAGRAAMRGEARRLIRRYCSGPQGLTVAGTRRRWEEGSPLRRAPWVVIEWGMGRQGWAGGCHVGDGSGGRGWLSQVIRVVWMQTPASGASLPLSEPLALLGLCDPTWRSTVCCISSKR